jgi:two-component system NtrC family sensor kinase
MKSVTAPVKCRSDDELFKTLSEELPVGVCIMQDGKFCYINSTFPIAIGYTPDQLVGRDSLDIVVPEDREMVKENTINMLKGELRSPYQFKVVCEDRSIAWVTGTVKSVQYRGRPAVLGTYMEITERKQIEQATKEMEERYMELANSITDVFFAMDENLRYTYWNKASEMLTGIRAEDAIGKSLLEIFPDSPGLRRAEKAYRAVLNTGKSQAFVNDFEIDGRHYIFEITAYPSREGISVFVRDITERKRAEEELRQSEENYRALFDSSVIGTIVLDAETMKVVMANQSAVEMFRFSTPEEILRADPLAFIHPDDREGIQVLARESLFEQDLRQTHSVRAITKDGREIWISASGARIMHEGRLAGLISFTDITEQKRQNERLAMADRLASIGELAAGTAHELNNPLASIIGLSELLMERNTPDYIRGDLAMIRDEARRAANVTSNLLTFARKHRPMKQLTQINTIIEDVLELRAYAHKSDSINVVRHLASDLPETQIDHFQMQQVFLNIVINAEYFMTKAHKGGTLTIITRTQNSGVKISFADDGPGIAPENLGRIFDPFFTTKEAGMGTGLGLSICHGIVAAHGGQICARSQSGKGATVFIELPIDTSEHVEGMI